MIPQVNAVSGLVYTSDSGARPMLGLKRSTRSPGSSDNSRLKNELCSIRSGDTRFLFVGTPFVMYPTGTAG